MKRIASIMLVVWGMLILVGCDHQAERLLEQAEAYLPAKPDSAALCLDSIKQPEKLDDAERAWYGVLRTYADNRKGKEIKSDSLIRDSYEYYREASHDGETFDKTLMHRYAQSCYYMALFYSSCDSTKQCEDMLHQAITYSEKCEDWHTCYLAYTQLGKSTLWSNQKYAIQQSLKALDIYHKINDDVNNEVLILGHIASNYLSITEADSAMKYYRKGYDLAEKKHLIESQNEMCIGIAVTCLYMQEYEKALNYAKRGSTLTDSTSLIVSRLTLAQCYQACDSLEKSRVILESICNNANLTHKYFIYRDLSRIAIQNKDFNSLYAYVDSAYKCLEDRFLQSQSVKDEYYQENLVKKLEKEKIQHEAEMHRWIGTSIILFTLLIAAFIIYNVLRHKRRMEADHQKEMLHKQEIIHQKSMTLAVLQKHLLEKLEYTRQLLSDSDETYMTKEAWDEIERLINDTDNQFVQTLRQQHKEFREEDIQLCMLVRLKMNNTVISKIYHIGVDAVKKRKLALKKNGFHITDPDTPLEDVIDKLS